MQKWGTDGFFYSTTGTGTGEVGSFLPFYAVA
jgi:hypothetical protein